MKLYVNILLLLLLGLGAASCTGSFLDETQTTDLDKNTVFADSTYTAGFLTQIYTNIDFDIKYNRFNSYFLGIRTVDGGGLQVACDEAEFKQSSTLSTGIMFATGTLNPVSVTNDAWQKCYENIRRVNVFLANVDGSPIVSSIKTQYKAEARFLRAWYYFLLLRHYGGIPLIGDEVYEADSQMKTSRNTFAECVEYIASECRAVLEMNVLPVRQSGRNSGRISEAAIKGLLARLYLYAASPLYNGSDFATPETKELLGYPTYDKERWKTAIDAAVAVLSLNGYDLYERNTDADNAPEMGWGFYGIFHAGEYYVKTDGADGKYYPLGVYAEIIFQGKLQRNNALEGCFYPPSGNGNGSGGYIYKELADAFPMADGKAIEKGGSKYTYDPLQPQVNRDPRFKNSVVYDGSTVAVDGTGTQGVVNLWQGPGATTDAVHAGTPTGYYTRKGANRYSWGDSWNPQHHTDPLIRYADVMLMFAEAANEYYGPDYQLPLGERILGCYEVLKAIRKRAGIEAGDDGMYGIKPNMSQAEMREAIRFERRIELAFEGHRFFDVRRWMIADQTDSQTMHGQEITRAADGTKTSKPFVVRTHVWRKAMYFWPIPYAETVKSDDLIQNPYYE